MHRYIRRLLHTFQAVCLILATANTANAVVRMPAEDILLSNPAPQVVIPDFNREDALNDPQNRIGEDFKIPKNLRARTAFWFDIYTKYGSQDHVIHHGLYPWIVFKVVDTNPIFESDMNKWTKVNKAKLLVRNESHRIRAALTRLAKMKKHPHLKAGDQDLINALASVKGSRSKVYREAAINLRTQLGQKDFFTSGLAVSSKYLPFMEREFTSNGLPTELTRLPFVESSFNVSAGSKVGASGIWQIMPYMGREFLIVGDVIDERNSPFKSSLVAAELFKENYHKFQSWPLAITAYNHGWEGLRDAIEETRSEDLAVIISKYHHGAFKFASSNFFTCFLAALHAEKYHAEIFKDLKAEEPPVDFKVVTLQYKSKPLQLAKRLGISTDDLLTYNLDLKHALKKNSILPKGYYLILPTQYDQSVQRAMLSRQNNLREAELHVNKKKSAS